MSASTEGHADHPIATGTRALLFDLGGVMFDIDFDRALAHWAPISQLGFDEIKRRFHFDEAYRRHECGALSARDYFEHLRTILELEPDYARIEEGWHRIFLDEIEETRTMVEAARQRFPCYAFTNTNAVHQAKWITLFPRVVRCFDRIFASHEIGLRKPDPEAFSYVVSALDVAPAAILFFDDTLVNVEGALQAGLAAVHVRGPDDVRRALGAALDDDSAAIDSVAATD